MAEVTVSVPDADILAAVDARVQRLEKDNAKKLAQIQNLKEDLAKRKEKDEAVKKFVDGVMGLVVQHFPDETYWHFGE